MVDVLTKKQRSFNMSRIRSTDTKPEMVVRKLVHSLGYRYRLHVRALPGCPDIVFASRQKVILVHGCFWHRHRCKSGSPKPKTREGFWKKKLADNKARDARHRRELKQLGWKVLTIWECQTSPRHIKKLEERIICFMQMQ
ncbi:MAG: DNA mismatch endonuclease Vsr [Desulfobacteraceae bacterium]|nr:DNA mismatch endonuclease Vsr [Desulfobacteraceae bacterium]